jgi:hypothetical protein
MRIAYVLNREPERLPSQRREADECDLQGTTLGEIRDRAVDRF